MVEKQMLRAAEVAPLLSVSRETLFRWVRVGHFPAGIKLGPNVRAWPRDVVESWIAARASVKASN
jgi:prophage regulatory protein